MDRKKKSIADRYYNYLKGKTKKLDPEMVDVIICDFMGWDYWTYRNQPAWFIDLLMTKKIIDEAFRKNKK